VHESTSVVQARDLTVIETNGRPHEGTLSWGQPMGAQHWDRITIPRPPTDPDEVTWMLHLQARLTPGGVMAVTMPDGRVTTWTAGGDNTWTEPR
jgi:hypothetical protein